MMVKIDKTLLLYLSLGFVIFTIIGTLSHESGHYIVAKILGYDASIHYAFTRWSPKHPLQHKNYWDSVLVTLGGPIQTILTGTIAAIYLCYNRAKFKASEMLTFQQWIWVFVALFWLRQTSNFILLLFAFLLNGVWEKASDEAYLEFYFQLPHNSVSVTSGLIGCAILL